MLVFISWSGERSKAIAKEWEQILRPVIQGVQVFWSPRIKSGRRQWEELSAALANSNLGIICVTPENKDKPWLMFEAGALSKSPQVSRLCTCLLELEPRDLDSSPLAPFEHSLANEDGVRRILDTINEALGKAALPPETLDRLFAKFWPDFRKGLDHIPKKARRPKRPKRTTEADKLNQILDLLQEKASFGMTIGDFVKNPGTAGIGVITYPSPLARDFRQWLGGLKVAIHKFKRGDTGIDSFRPFNRGLIQFVKTWDSVLPESIRLEILQMPRDFDLLPEYEADGTINNVLDRLYAHAASIYERLS